MSNRLFLQSSREDRERGSKYQRTIHGKSIDKSCYSSPVGTGMNKG